MSTTTPTPTVLFLCPHNALRSVIAAALFNQRADGRALGESAGTAAGRPRERAHGHGSARGRHRSARGEAGPAHLRAAQAGRPGSSAWTARLPPDLAAIAADKIENWPMPDTAGKPVEAVREVRELIRARVEQLLAELGAASGGDDERR